jgi:putative transposase
LARLYRRIKNIRKDFLKKESTKLAKTKSVICIEDLNVSGMLKNHHLARSIGDEGWGEFRRMLEYKTQWYGSRLIVIPMFEPSSKRCNHCGEINHDLKLSDREWICLKCGSFNNRDENAAHNIRDKGIERLDTDSLSELQACGVDVRLSSMIADDGEAGSKHILDDKTYETVARV